ncbi:MAG: histidine phosphatase family protein [Clostridiales Family XIII bacterium]|nr:histidine phosphatase family protein [Clostridiales Family XIII bacterium]
MTRIVLVRHGEPEQHSGRIFLGQTDVPLSVRGRAEAAAAGDALVRLGVRAERVYASDLKRAKETADIVAAALGGIPVVSDKLFREMDMGSWDGEFIEEIKQKFPEEYAKRGQNILNYRIPGGENFYDLRGRVAREFFRVWKDEFLPKALRGADCGGGTHGRRRGDGGGGTRRGVCVRRHRSVGERLTAHRTPVMGAEGAAAWPQETEGDLRGADHAPEDLVIVAHMGVIRALVAELTQDDEEATWRRAYPTGSVTAIDAPCWLFPADGFDASGEKEGS